MICNLGDPMSLRHPVRDHLMKPLPQFIVYELDNPYNSKRNYTQNSVWVRQLINPYTSKRTYTQSSTQRETTLWVESWDDLFYDLWEMIISGHGGNRMRVNSQPSWDNHLWVVAEVRLPVGAEARLCVVAEVRLWPQLIEWTVIVCPLPQLIVMRWSYILWPLS